ncbi:MAG: hypothetical protein LWX83_18330, partial [Anaerolineae bacterium]|nr:hypothetical protein [Anaerolineae bacterium]
MAGTIQHTVFVSSFIWMTVLSTLCLRGAELSEKTITSIAKLSCPLIILSSKDDPYHSLAEEIARVESAPLADNLQDALACPPDYLLWVVSPQFLSDAVLVDFGLTMKAQPLTVASGIITASTLEGARALWQKGQFLNADHMAVINAANPAAHISAGQIKSISDNKTLAGMPLTKASFIRFLATVDYLTFTGHGSSGYLRIDENTTLSTNDIPRLDSILISTGSCQTFEPWKEDSITRRFIDRGAMGYAGFVFSPNEGYLIGEFSDLPYRYTWPEFPIGDVIQVQNHASLLGYAHFPYQQLLGDPRLALQPGPVYILKHDKTAGNERTLLYSAVPAGAIPIRIPEGAKYSFVEVPGAKGTAVSEHDLFYNSRLAMVNKQADKLLLYLHSGGDLTVRLVEKTPWYWFALDTLLDSFDYVYVFCPQSGGDILTMVAAIIPLVWVIRQFILKRYNRRLIYWGTGLGLASVLLHGMYIVFRLDQISIISKTVVFNPLSLLATFIPVFCGVLISARSRSKIGRLMALVVVTFPAWSVFVFNGLIITIFNRMFFFPEFGTDLYNYSLSLLTILPFIMTFSGYGLLFKTVSDRGLITK